VKLEFALRAIPHPKRNRCQTHYREISNSPNTLSALLLPFLDDHSPETRRAFPTKNPVAEIPRRVQADGHSEPPGSDGSHAKHQRPDASPEYGSRQGQASSHVFSGERQSNDNMRTPDTYLRPAAVAAGVISEAGNSRFGWHNLRHSLATFFGSNDVHPSVIQTVLRHAKQQTTTRYIHSVNDKQLEAQGLYLDAIKIRKKCRQPSGRRRLRVESRVGRRSNEYVTA
jgi:hypothetical protein